MKKNAATLKSYRVTLIGEPKKRAEHRVRAKRAQDALTMVAGDLFPSNYRQDGALKNGRTLLWVIEPSKGDARAVVVDVVRLAPKKPMGAPVRDPRPTPAPMTVGVLFWADVAETGDTGHEEPTMADLVGLLQIVAGGRRNSVQEGRRSRWCGVRLV